MLTLWIITYLIFPLNYIKRMFEYERKITETMG